MYVFEFVFNRETETLPGFTWRITTERFYLDTLAPVASGKSATVGSKWKWKRKWKWTKRTKVLVSIRVSIRIDAIFNVAASPIQFPVTGVTMEVWGRASTGGWGTEVPSGFQWQSVIKGLRQPPPPSEIHTYTIWSWQMHPQHLPSTPRKLRISANFKTHCTEVVTLWTLKRGANYFGKLLLSKYE